MTSSPDDTRQAAPFFRRRWPGFVAVVILWALLQFPGGGVYALPLLLAGGLVGGLAIALALWRSYAATPSRLSYNKWPLLLLSALLVLLARGLQLGHVDDDYVRFLHPWYGYIQAHGVTAYKDRFTNYTPFYTYLMGLPALLLPRASPLLAIKLLSFPGEIIAAFYAYRIVALRHDTHGPLPLLAALLLLLLPTVIVNGAYIGQCDAWYAAFLLGCIFHAMRVQPARSMLCFAFALSLKLQAIFLSPFLLILVLNRRLPWFYFALAPVVYALTCLPAWIAGRPVFDLATIYLYQFDQDNKLSHHAPTLYLLFSKHFKYGDAVKWTGVVATGLLMAIFSWRNRHRLTGQPAPELYLFLALGSLALTPFFLPKMHDRYFYPADLVSLLFALMVPRWWFLPVGFQLVSALSIYQEIPGMDAIFGTHPYLVFIALAVNVAIALPLYWLSVRRNSGTSEPWESLARPVA